MSGGEEEKEELITLSRSDSHLVSLRAKKSGKYVTTTAGKFIVELEGLLRATPKKGKAQFPGKLIESKLIFSRFVFLGTLYPDGSSVPFVPLEDVKMIKQDSPSARQKQVVSYYDSGGYSRARNTDSDSLPTPYHVEVTISSAAWSRLKPELHDWYRDLQVHENVNVRQEKAFLLCEVEPDRDVAVCLNGIWFEKRIDHALNKMGELRGNVFLMPKYTRTPTSGKATLSFQIYGMWLTDDVERLFGPFTWQKIIY